MAPFVPDDFELPRPPVDERFVLEPLGPEHNESDYAAWTSSLDWIRSTPDFAGRSWPRPMTLEENRGDLQRHADDFAARTGFTYTVLDPATREVIGCVYVYPNSLRSWVRADRAELDGPLRDAVREWLRAGWVFTNAAYPP